MKVYVASAFANREEVRRLMDTLEAEGHEITHDWTAESDKGMSGERRDAYLGTCAQSDYEGVLGCDALVLLDHPDARGAYTEFGIALATGKKVYVDTDMFEHPRGANIFLRLGNIEFIYDYDDLLAMLEENP